MSGQHRQPPGFCDLFDEAQARAGLPALFVVNARGELRLASDKTRDAWQRLPRDAEGWAICPPREVCHCLLRDRATGWVQYVLATAWELVADHPRADVRRYPSQQEALDALAALGPVPVAREAWEE
ncbi:MAG: hypothetical protein D6798_09170 [Deltaproteobacteria bacterium]|nr:MAG: hypothetical protein D6798_09170 [Deltaproteobacteria bacterium]